MPHQYQTIIIGAGPAGLIAGRYLEDALILDKKKEIGKPVQCGEGISKKALEMQDIKPNPSWICCEIHKIARIMPNGKAIGRLHEEPIGYVIDREKFEKNLANQVKCEIKLNRKVVDLSFKNGFWEVATENGEVFRATYLIGADGVSSVVRKKIFPENQQQTKFIPAVEYLVKVKEEIDTKIIKIYLDNEKYPEGYVWFFPKSKYTANIGIDGNADLSKRLKEFLEKNYVDYEIVENRSGNISCQKSDLKLFKNNAMLIGDGASLADPILHGGINQAMTSGKIISQLILKNKVDLYDSKIKSISFADSNPNQAAEIFYSLNNKVLNQLGDLLAGKGFSHLKTLPCVAKTIFKPQIIKNIPKLYTFFSAWRKNRDYL